MHVLGYIPVIKVRNTGIQQDIEKIGEIEDCEIKPIVLKANRILHCPVDPEYPERFDQDVQE